MTRSVVVDARWIGHTGIGRVVEQFLQGLGEIQPAAPWTVWGPERSRAYSRASATYVVTERSPVAVGGQRELFAIPPGDVILSLHAVRPLAVWRPTVVLLHDVIPALYGPRLERTAWRAFLTASTRTAERVLVNSDATADRAMSLLGIDRRRLRRVGLGVSASLQDHLRTSRRTATRRSGLLYVGRIRRHKNVDRALAAFASSQFARTGELFTIATATESDAEQARQLVAFSRETRVIIEVGLDDGEIAERYVAARAVILPSSEEGFGLPILEARAAGAVVCCSDIRAHREAAGGDPSVEWFDPDDVRSITAAIDRALVSGGAPTPPASWSPSEFALEVIDAAGL